MKPITEVILNITFPQLLCFTSLLYVLTAKCVGGEERIGSKAYVVSQAVPVTVFLLKKAGIAKLIGMNDYWLETYLALTTLKPTLISVNWNGPFKVHFSVF